MVFKSLDDMPKHLFQMLADRRVLAPEQVAVAVYARACLFLVVCRKLRLDLYINNQTLLPAEVAMSRFRSGDLHLDTEIDTEKRTAALASTELAPMGAAKVEAEAEQAKDLAVTSASAKGEAAVGVKKAPAGPAAKVPGGGKKPGAKKPAAK